MVKYLTFALMLYTVTYSNGQSSNWTIGFRPGIGWSGVRKTTGIDREVTDRFKPGFSFGAGARIGYKLSRCLSIALDPEWQLFRIKDHALITFWTSLMLRAIRFF